VSHDTDRTNRRRAWALGRGLAPLAALALLACGGGSPIDNPADIENAEGGRGQKLSFAYFQKCIQPIYVASLPIVLNGVQSINTCASSGCHDNRDGTGGALRVVGDAAPVDLALAASDPAAVRETDMYRNYYSSLGSVLLNAPGDSRLLTKPLVRGVLHGGGLIFTGDEDPNAKLIRYWISRPAPEGQDEFSAAGDTMFTPPDPATGTCNVE
jgi:hypothetical protein